MTKFYPVTDIKLGPDVMAEATGEFRAPKNGEWFLSGAIDQALQARADLNIHYCIAKLVRVKTVTTIVKVGDYTPSDL